MPIELKVDAYFGDWTPKEHYFCDVCGDEDEQAKVKRNVYDEDVVVCRECWWAGKLWAARQAHKEKP